MQEVPDFLAGSIAVSGDFWHFSRTPAVVGSTPQVGEHNEEVLGGLLGYSEEEIAQMREANVIADFDHYDEVPGLVGLSTKGHEAALRRGPQVRGPFSFSEYPGLERRASLRSELYRMWDHLFSVGV